MPTPNPPSASETPKRERSPEDGSKDGSPRNRRIKVEPVEGGRSLHSIPQRSAGVQELERRVQALEAQCKADSISPELLRGVYRQALIAVRAEVHASTAETNQRLSALDSLTAEARAERIWLKQSSLALSATITQQQASIAHLRATFMASASSSSSQLTGTNIVNPSVGSLGATPATGIWRPTAESSPLASRGVLPKRAVAGRSIYSGTQQMLVELANDSSTQQELTDSIEAFRMHVEGIVGKLAAEAVARRFPRQQLSGNTSVNSSALSGQPGPRPSSMTSAPSKPSGPPA